MATLREYFDTDFPAVLNAGTVLSVSFRTETALVPVTYEIPARVNYDFDGGTKYVSCFIPSGPATYALCEAVMVNPQWTLEAAGKAVEVQSGYPGQRFLKASDLKFVGRVFLYTEDLLSTDEVTRLEAIGAQKDISPVVRTSASAEERSRFEKPLAFISHDSRDKELIARPIAMGLSKMRCPVWYDEYSLKVGDSLRRSIEKGLKESKKCVLILSPNFLSNEGWTRTEFDSVFTRQILEGSDVVLPVWAGVTKQQVYEYSPSLLDRIGAIWDEGQEAVLRKLYNAIEPSPRNYTAV